jgi:phage FluMu protein Com
VEERTMTEDDIRRAILSSVMGISSAIDITIEYGGVVTIRCSMPDPNASRQSLANRLAEIMNVLQPRRPAGIAFRIELMSVSGMMVGEFDRNDVPLIVSDRIKEGTFVDLSEEDPYEENLQVMRLQLAQIRSRSRFSAVVEEMSDAVPAVSQPAPSARVERRTTPQLFEETIRIVDGVIDPCKKCGCSAYTMDFRQIAAVKATCRGCPLPGPIYAVEYANSRSFSSQLPQTLYRCERCSTVTIVTMNLADVNLHCPTCKQLTVHTSRGTEKAPTKDEYAYEQRTVNQKNGLKERNWNRRTGRTTRCLVDALATCVIEGYRVLVIRGRSNTIENAVVGMARPMIERIDGVLRAADAKTILPIQQHLVGRNVKITDQFTYVDHTMNER